ncbi:MAG: cyclodeaminase/cyclohydrolase family protein [Lachnospiraceae bacterium]|nr:cyclodeaminase/cyclohydrolase family protein [Lachnospiraceae bacterium]
MQELDERMERFLTELASKAPIPGGGGAAALMGSLAAALGSMVGNLTTGKKKYEQYQQDIEHILSVLQDSLWEIYEYIEKDAQAFEPLAKAYKIPRDQPGREELMEEVTLQAAKVPLDLTKKLYGIIPLLEELEVKGSRLAISDVAVAASCLASALESGVMNIYINTRSLKNRKLAEEINEEAKRMSGEGVLRCKKIYERILETLV